MEEMQRGRGIPADMRVARRILAHEMGDRQGLVGLSEGAEQASRKMAGVLIGLVSAVGSQALFARALYLSRAEFPFLVGVRAGTSPESNLEGLRASLEGVEVERAREGVASVLASLIGLMITFLGENLTWRLLGRAWPEALLSDDEVVLREA